jgi:hypothetical protein
MLFAAMRCCHCEILCFLLNNFRMRYPYESPLFCGSVSALRMRLHACLAVMRCLDDISCFSAADFSFWWLDVRTVERWI